MAVLLYKNYVLYRRLNILEHDLCENVCVNYIYNAFMCTAKQLSKANGQVTNSRTAEQPNSAPSRVLLKFKYKYMICFEVFLAGMNVVGRAKQETRHIRGLNITATIAFIDLPARTEQC